MIDALTDHVLNDGTTLPAIGFGSFPHHGEDSAEMVDSALDAGYRLIDTALRYGNEEEVGDGIRRSGVPRADIVLTSKLPGRYHGREEARTAVTESLANLRADGIDLYLIHWPLPNVDKYVDTWRTLVDLQAEGVLRSIGVSNFLPEHLEAIIAATCVTPAVNQIESHPWFPQTDVRAANTELGIVTEAWSPLGRGTGVLQDPVVADIATRHGASPAQTVLRWHVQQGVVPIPMSSNPDRRKANLDVAGFALTSDEIAELTALDRGEGLWHQDPRTHEEF